MATATAIAVEQEERRDNCKPFIPASEVVRRLAVPARPATGKTSRVEHRDGEGRVMAWAQKGRGGVIMVTLTGAGKRDKAELVGAAADLVQQLLR